MHDILAGYGTAGTAEKTRAEDFLRQALAGGPRRTTDVEEEAKQIHGIARRTWSGPGARSGYRLRSGRPASRGPRTARQRSSGGSPRPSTRATSPTSGQAASTPAPQKVGGLHQQPDGGERVNVRTFSDSGQPPKAGRWSEGSAGADANPAA